MVEQEGQNVIDEDIRDALGLEIGSYPPEHDLSLRGALAGDARRAATPESWPKMREKAWSDAVRSEWRTDGDLADSAMTDEA